MPEERRAGRASRSSTPGAPNRSKQICVCDSPSNRIDADAERDERDVGRPSSRARAGRSRTAARRTRPVLVDQARTGEPAEQPEPDRERLAVRAPLVAPELGHHRQRERGVADEDDEQRRRPGLRGRARARRRRRSRWPPASGRARPGSRPASQPATPSRRRTAAPRSWSVENGSRKCQTGPTSAQTHRQADPAVDPQEERRDVAVARAADDALGDDPDPADEPERPERVAEPRPAAGDPRPVEVGRRRADVADEHEDERQGDRRSRPRRGRPPAAAGSCRSR